MATIIRSEDRYLSPRLLLPVNVTVELMNALCQNEAIIAAMSFAAHWLFGSLREGKSSVIFECSGVNIIASLEEDDSGWYIMVECCNAAAFAPDRMANRSHHRSEKETQ